MRQERSVHHRLQQALAGCAVTILGIAALLFLTPALVGPLGVGLRGAVALGTVLLGGPALVTLLQPSARIRELGRPIDRRTAGLCALLGAALWVGSLGVITLQAVVWPLTPEQIDVFRRLHAALAPRDALDAVVSVVVIAVMPALMEELVMRGVLLTSLAPLIGTWPAVATTAFVFAVIHDPVRLAFAFVLGLAFGLLRVRTGSLWPSITVHATLNTLTFLIAPLVDDPTQSYTPQPLLGTGCLIVGVVLSWPLIRALRPTPAATGAR